MKPYWMLSVAALALTACSGPESAAPTVETPPLSLGTEVEIVPPTLAEIAAGDWRSDAEKARDTWRHPVETLEFFGVKHTDTVAELWPGGGWYSNIIAPYLESGDGQLIAVQWDLDQAEGERLEMLTKRIADYMAVYAADPDLFGRVQLSAFSSESDEFADPGTVDVVLTFRNVHNWMGGDYSDKFFTDAYAALKPGGTLGVVDHRLPSSAEQDPRATTGYVHEDFVKAMAINAGFEFVAASEINANPADTADHPFGVWTLPPVSRDADRDGNGVEGFDPEKYVAIGESDRMTLKFSKPDLTSEPVE